MASMRFFVREDGLLQSTKRAFSAREFREAVAQMDRMVGNDAKLRAAVGINEALDYATRLKQTPVAQPQRAPQAVLWSVAPKRGC